MLRQSFLSKIFHKNIKSLNLLSLNKPQVFFAVVVLTFDAAFVDVVDVVVVGVL